MDDSEIMFNNRISDSLIEFDQDMSCPSNLMDMHVVDEVTCTPSASASTPNYSNVERLMQNKFDDFLHQIDQMFKNTKEEMQHMTNKAMDKVDRDIAALRAQVTPPHVQSLGSGDQTHVTRNSLVDFDQRITDCNGSTFNPHMQGERTSQYLEQATSSNNMFSTQNVLFNNNNNDNIATANRWSGPSTLAPGRSSLVAGRSNSGVRTPHQKQTSNSNINGSIKMKPQYYDGTEDLDDYLSQFEILAELNAWNYVTKSLYLAGSLKGDARTLLSELSPMERKDYQSLVQILNLRFGSMNRAEIFKANLQTRVKRKEESISELAQSIKKLTRQAYPNAPPALIFTLAKDHFIDALPESDMRLRIREAQSKDIAEAEILALQLEAYRVADKQKTNRYRGHPLNAVATNESACLDDPESFTKTFMDGFRQEMKSLTNDIKQVVKSAQSSQPGKTNDNYSNNKQWSNNYQNKGNYQNRNNNNGSGNNNRNNSYNGQNNNNSRNQNGRNDQNGNTAHNYGQGYSGNRDLSNTGPV
ncbi:unnamed protein product [Mytilus edulis]|uniref:Uncharacterized protein n=1 Tax=Mytilus edulis TaxID=6550 RepID=A0A8S3SJV5_MYTED|nr:unnamed protein product [Mytilus edulis]